MLCSVDYAEIINLQIQTEESLPGRYPRLKVRPSLATSRFLQITPLIVDEHLPLSYQNIVEIGLERPRPLSSLACAQACANTRRGEYNPSQRSTCTACKPARSTHMFTTPPSNPHLQQLAIPLMHISNPGFSASTKPLPRFERPHLEPLNSINWGRRLPPFVEMG
ncbi:hypothetical protein GALMADRAFT_1141577 [Galerina marginata CBS 339.88]|uniref:Uncharacterized protein n=1 Tax=Galerina marginata (strain CBS 339.88) TaxID=685588 RepID=A0A067SGG7_GALM3|nr:hypothetical protein GALMADRAFT_1141577 [Galerina marginata CBS 339.88]